MGSKTRELLIFLGIIAVSLVVVYFAVSGTKSGPGSSDTPIKRQPGANPNATEPNGSPKNPNATGQGSGRGTPKPGQGGFNGAQNNPGQEIPGQVQGPGTPGGNQPQANKPLPSWAYHKGKVETLGGAIVVGVDYLIQRSQKVVVGQVVSTKARLTKDKQFIVTDVQVVVDQALKGEVEGNTMTITIIGGTLDNGTTLEVTHQPRFLPGDEGFFFVDKDPDRLTELAANAQGYLRIDRPDPKSKVVRDGFNRMVYGLEENGHLDTNSQNGSKKRLTVSDMSDYISRKVKGQ